MPAVNITIGNNVTLGLASDCRVLGELGGVLALLVGFLLLPALAMVLWPIPGPTTPAPWATLRAPSLLADACNFVSCVGYLYARFGQTSMYESVGGPLTLVARRPSPTAADTCWSVAPL
jgi:hypothetical protein